MTIKTIGQTTYRRYINKQVVFEISVQQMIGHVAAHFASSMQIDADGAPRGYHEADQREYDNHQQCFDWLKNLKPSDRHGRQGIDGFGPAYGFTISGTSLEDKRKGKRDVARYVDASEIPYVVLPANFPLPDGALKSDVWDWLGCIAYVIDLESGHASGAVFADVGNHVGEGSIALAQRLCRRPFYPKYPPKVCGIDSKRFCFIIFPNEIMTMPLNVSEIEARAKTCFDTWGGWPGLDQALKSTPQEKPHYAEDDNIAQLHLPAPKGPCSSPYSYPTIRVARAAENAELFDIPIRGRVIAKIRAGQQIDLVQQLANSTWLRVMIESHGKTVEGYMESKALDRSGSPSDPATSPASPTSDH